MNFRLPHISFVLVAGLLLIVASGCTMAPVYERPEAPVPQIFPEYPEFKGVGATDADKEAVRKSRTVTWGIKPGEMEELDADGQPIRAEDETPAPGNLAWREFFTDPTMQLLIDTAIANNKDLRLSALSLERARAMYQIQRADLMPSINTVGTNNNQLLPADVARASEATISRQSSLTVGFTSYEIDFFGRIQSLKDAALENYLATAHNVHSVHSSIVAEVASVYLQLVAYKEQYALAESTYNTRKESYRMTNIMYRKGVASKLALNQSKAAMEEARVSAAQFKTSILLYENALVLLLGKPIPEEAVIPSRLADIIRLPEVPAGIPSQLLERRPDILASEHLLKGSNANIGAARASFFPRISLTGNLGYLSSDMNDLLKSGSKTWTFAPQVALPIFQGGKLIANLEMSSVEKEMAIVSYEKTIQTAFREVSDALAQRSTITERMNATKSLLGAAQQSYDISKLRYEVGIDSYLNVLDAQRMLFSAEQSYINTILAREINSLTLYKVLGGGWQ